MTSHPGIVLGKRPGSARRAPLGVLTWNLFHGRDFPPDPALFTWRSRLLRITERNATHEQVNRELLPEFASALDAMPWDIGLLQEMPPRWRRKLPERLGADAASGLTSRNQLLALRTLAARINPDLIASNDGGANAILVRPPGRVERVECHTLAQRPERRALLLARIAGLPIGPVAVACMHLSVPGTGQGPAELARAAELAVEFAGGAPLVLGGDLNLRPRRAAKAFAEVHEAHGLSQPTEPEAIDHLLVRDLDVVEPPRSFDPSSREVPAKGGRMLRLSDHAPVAGSFEVR